MEVELPSQLEPPHQPLDVGRVEDSAPAAPLGEQQLAHEAPEPAPEPVPERHREAVLRPVDDRVRQDPPHGLLEHVLRRAAAQVELRRDRRRELDQLVIEQRHASLDRVRHAHPVDLGEDVQRQVAFEVQVLQRREPPSVGRGQVLGFRAPRIVLREQREHVVAEQALLLVPPEQRRRVQVALVADERQVAQEVAAPRPVGQRLADGPRQSPRRRRQEPVPALPGLDAILVVPGEELVAAVARERDGDVPGGQLRDHVGRDRRGVAERLVQIPGEVIDDLEGVRLEQELVVLGPEPLGHEPRVARLVVVRLREADRERLHRARVQPRHGRHDRARIDAAAQERAQRHVAHEVQADGFLDELAEPLHEVRLGPSVLGLEAWIPVPFGAHAPARRGEQNVPGLELADAVDDAVRRGRAPEREEAADRAPVEVALDVDRLQQRLQLRREEELAAGLGIVERLDAQPVASHQQRPAARIPEGEGEHAAQLLHAVGLVLLVEVDDRLRVRRGVEGMPTRLELAAELPEVVDLAVEDDPHRAVLVPDGLAPGLEVDDPQAPHPQAHPRTQMKAVVVGAAMGDDPAHCAHLVQGDWAPVEAQRAGDAAHVELSAQDTRPSPYGFTARVPRTHRTFTRVLPRPRGAKT